MWTATYSENCASKRMIFRFVLECLVCLWAHKGNGAQSEQFATVYVPRWDMTAYRSIRRYVRDATQVSGNGPVAQAAHNVDRIAHRFLTYIWSYLRPAQISLTVLRMGAKVGSVCCAFAHFPYDGTYMTLTVHSSIRRFNNGIIERPYASSYGIGPASFAN